MTTNGQLEPLVTYILTVGKTSVADLGPVIDRLGPRAKEVIMTTAEQLRAEGEALGEAKGRAETLIELLSLKFGPLTDATSAAIRTADSAQLRAWTARVLTAGSVEEVFEA
ncbi:hypothetical protein [Nocardia inohanensis]|uniref:hypothetical protein n=1 Tax=Nocardia inohanensis TaxID=209246 RepID=UPI0012F9CA39|nr:hypothetical protein [Nocardia inohanensis]